MPHKHKRKRDEDQTNFDLPPTSRARSLTVHQKQESVFTRTEGDNKRRKGKKPKTDDALLDDDTPKAFARLMRFQGSGNKMPSGLDDGTNKNGKKKQKATSTTTSKGESAATSSNTAAAGAGADNSQAQEQPMLKPLPNEPLSHFSARVDQSLPLSSIPKHTTRLTNIPGMEKFKTPLTKHNKRLARMQADWRAQDAKARAKREEEDDELADKREEDALLWLSAGIADPSAVQRGEGGKGKKKKGKGKSGVVGAVVDDVDPWKVLEKKRAAEGELRQASLQDVVLAPPVLKGVKNIFKIKPGQAEA